jgi:hypothetical protein
LHIPDPEQDEGKKDDIDSGYVWGVKKELYSGTYPTPIECHIGYDPVSDCTLSTTPTGDPKGFAILTLCWSYIISTRFSN